MSRDERQAGGLGSDLPLPEELRRGLLEIAVGEHLDRDGEARTAELESVHWPRLEPSAALMERLLAIPVRPSRLTTPHAWRGPGLTIAASYLLAVALTLALGDPLSFGRRASSEFRAVAGERLLEPASRAGASIHTELSQRLGRLQGSWPATGFLREPLDLPTGRVSAWFRGAVDSSSAAFNGLADLLPFADSGNGDESPATNRSSPNRPQSRDDRERTFA
ncbi:MAG: hypothetical protein F4112_14665 [Holophagales bacterium]|nr:hypothetical protein [Holophagales bacterium]MYD22271.1 hypothetical protein [Holophagales bacterium]MYI34189.1 hypothetical protein [Holophagales bacterium]